MMTSETMNSNKIKIGIIITAAGSSTRIGSGIKKEYLPYNNGTVLSSCAKVFLKACLKSYEISDFIITCPIGGKSDCEKALTCDSELQPLLHRIVRKFPNIVEGSVSRQKSVYNGLLAVKNDPEIILIHDGARPFVTEKIILDTIDAAKEYGAAVPGITPTDTQKEIDEDGFILRHLQRSKLTAVQTPQGFRFTDLFEAHTTASEEPVEYTDDTEIWGKYYGKVKIIEGDSSNIKITYPEDLYKLNR